MDENYGTIGGDFDDDRLQYPGEDGYDDISVNAADLVVRQPISTNPASAVDQLSMEDVSKKLKEPTLYEYPPDDVYVHPIDWHMRVPDYTENLERERWVKRRREEAVDMLARRIDEYRNRMMNAAAEKELEETSRRHTDDRDYNLAEVMRTPPVDGSPWMGVSTNDNIARVYIRLLRQRSSQSGLAARNKRQRHAQFTSVPVERLLNEANELRKQMATDQLAGLNGDISDRCADVLLDTIAMAPSGEVADSSLWVDRYRPRAFVDLLSDDHINRTVLTWLHLWDECVFGRKSAAAAHVEQKDKEHLAVEEKRPHRPNNKILLLAGPAGLGKTTLAGVLARHAGYTVTEVNASDNRNVSDFDRVLEGVVRCGRTVMGDRRPQCLILDEVDGAPAEAVNWLCKQVASEGRRAVRRPIIAICNSLYSPNLRELRQNAVVLTVNPTRKDRLTDRLDKICDQERVRVERSVLLRLVELCSCDVRLSVNTLQYVSQLRKAQDEPIGEEEIVKASERMRVGNRSLFDHWSMVLEAHKHLDRRGVVQSPAERVRTLEHMWLEASDDRDRLVAGLHCNYARHQPALPVSKLSAAATLFVYYDTINTRIQEKQNYTLMRYFLGFYAPLHLLLTTHAKIKLQYPQTEANISMRRKHSMDCLESVRACTAPGQPHTALLTEVLPLLITITQPAIKPVNESLLSARDRLVLRSTARALAYFGVTFKPSHVNNQTQYLYEPPIDRLTMFEINAPNRMFMPNAVREIVAQQAHLERIKMTESGDASVFAPDDNAPTDSLELALVDQRKRKRVGVATPEGAAERKRAKRAKDPKVKGVYLVYKPCGLNAVKTKVTLSQFLGM